MSRQKNARRVWYLALLGFVALILVVGLVSLRSPDSPVRWVIRVTATLGYLALFLATVSSAYMRQLVRFFGRPFVQVHHIMSISGLILIIVHPLAVAWDAASWRVFIPALDSWRSFLTYGGRVVWPLAGIASLAAWLRKPIGRNWRVVHYLNYVAFWLATAHAVLIGTNFQSVVMRVVAGLMALAVVAVFVQKRLGMRRRPGAKK